jgi:hypothetical protein
VTVFRESPSGELVDAFGGVESVFGRVGDVEAEFGDYNSSLIRNDSSVPGLSATDAIESLAGSNGHDNPSSVPGGTLTEALDYLNTNRAAPPAGSALDTFCGGSPGPFTSGNEAANIGDLGWNVGLEFGSASGWSVEKLPPESGSMGAYRVTPPTTQSSASTGPVLYLGEFNNTIDDGPFIFSDVGEIRFRARFDTTPVSPNLYTLIGLYGSTGAATVRLQFIGNSTNYRVVSSVNPGVSQTFDTLVPIDDEFHDFVIQRVSATEMRWLIDDVVVVTNTNPGSIPPGSAILTPIVSAGSNEAPNVTGTTFVDIDTWQFVPAS